MMIVPFEKQHTSEEEKEIENLFEKSYATDAFRVHRYTFHLCTHFALSLSLNFIFSIHFLKYHNNNE